MQLTTILLGWQLNWLLDCLEIYKIRGHLWHKLCTQFYKIRASWQPLGN